MYNKYVSIYVHCANPDFFPVDLVKFNVLRSSISLHFCNPKTIKYGLNAYELLLQFTVICFPLLAEAFHFNILIRVTVIWSTKSLIKDINCLFLKLPFHGSILLFPTRKIHVNNSINDMKSVLMRSIYANMQHNYVNMQQLHVNICNHILWKQHLI